MFLAEKRNENRLFNMYLAGEVDRSGNYSYPDDERNETADASFMVWRARTTRRGRVSAVCVQNEVWPPDDTRIKTRNADPTGHRGFETKQATQ